MSKSFKQNPVYLYDDCVPVRNAYKRHANKRVRKSNFVDNGSQYKKLYNYYSIGNFSIVFLHKKMLKDFSPAYDEKENLLKSS